MSKTSLWLDIIQKAQPFTPAEAWTLFRLAAFGEAIGWTLLISGIIIRSHHGFGSGVAVPLAGQIHGMLFLFYFAIALATFTSQRWPRWYFIPALLAGVFPYGTIIFEQLISHQKSKRHYNQLLSITAYQLSTNN